MHVLHSSGVSFQKSGSRSIDDICLGRMTGSSEFRFLLCFAFLFMCGFKSRFESALS